jgi:unsaturated rhamnogalacturonyl hydrolase
MIRCTRAILCVVMAGASLLPGETKPTPVTLRVANQEMGAKGTPAVWGFESGIALAGMSAVWSATRDPTYFDYLQHTVDRFVQPDGVITGYDMQAYALNNILIGRELLMLYRATHQEKYRRAAETLRRQIATQPRTASGGLCGYLPPATGSGRHCEAVQASRRTHPRFPDRTDVSRVG